MKKVSLLGVFVGGIVDIVATNILSLPFAIYMLTRYDLVHAANMQVAYVAAIHSNLGLYVVSGSIGFAGSVIGGYVAAWIAKHDELLNGILSSWLCVATGIWAVVAGKASVSLGEYMILFVLGLAAALLGGYLRMLQNRARQPLQTQS